MVSSTELHCGTCCAFGAAFNPACLSCNHGTFNLTSSSEKHCKRGQIAEVRLKNFKDYSEVFSLFCRYLREGKRSKEPPPILIVIMAVHGNW